MRQLTQLGDLGRRETCTLLAMLIHVTNQFNTIIGLQRCS